MEIQGYLSLLYHYCNLLADRISRRGLGAIVDICYLLDCVDREFFREPEIEYDHWRPERTADRGRIQPRRQLGRPLADARVHAQIRGPAWWDRAERARPPPVRGADGEGRGAGGESEHCARGAEAAALVQAGTAKAEGAGPGAAARAAQGFGEEDQGARLPRVAKAERQRQERPCQRDQRGQQRCGAWPQRSTSQPGVVEQVCRERHVRVQDDQEDRIRSPPRVRA
mmetsp:Transcript_67720/g.192182  ORF Transcript_67720/g.192182 Transcript_67720/m.192182 type:complete len:226 (+) Transcript_67720:143-820(+)